MNPMHPQVQERNLLEADAEDRDEDRHLEVDDDGKDGANAAEDGDVEANADVRADGEDGADESTEDLARYR